MIDVLLPLLAVVAASVLVWHGSVRLEKASAYLAVRYHLPPVVRGGLLAAVGSSLPELSSTILATALHGEFELGVSVIVGSAVFNVLVIPGLAGLASGGLRADRHFLYKDALFHISAVLVLLLSFSMAVVYNPLRTVQLAGEMERWIVALPLALYGLYLFMHHQDSVDERARNGDAPADGRAGGRPDRPADGVRPAETRRQWLMLAFGLALIVAGVEVLVQSAIALGELSGTPSFLWGATVVAAATSLPDAVISVRASRSGADTVSLANVLGSNIFDLLVAIPAGVLVVGHARVDFGVAAPLMGYLGIATIVLFALLRTELKLSVREAWGLLAVYAAFVAMMILETLGAIDVVRSGTVPL